MADQVIDICAAADLPDGSAVRFEVSIGGRRASAFVVRHHSVVTAFLNRCSHASTELDWQPGRFFDSENEYLVCATHGALFDPASGGCVGGPCLGRGGLRRVSVVENEGRVGWVPDGYVNPPGTSTSL